MDNIDECALRIRINAVMPVLSEYQRRRYLSAEAKATGYGGISLVSRLSGVSRQTVTDGVKEPEDPDARIMEPGGSRKSGGGRKAVCEKQPGILNVLEDPVSAHTKGDPARSLLWTNTSPRTLAGELKTKGFEVCYRVVGAMLSMSGYGLQADKKTLAIPPSHPDRDRQFEYINAETTKAMAAGNPVISIDAKKNEAVGNCKNNGRTCQKEKAPVQVPDHGFPIPEPGKATPFGVYRIFKNRGFVNVGLSADTAVFAVQSVGKRWYAGGLCEYGNASHIVITADCGGSNGYRSRLWKYELQRFANETGKTIKVLDYPVGTSKRNKIERRLFAFISTNRQGIPLISRAVIAALIGATKTEKGLSVTCVLDEAAYEKGIKVTDEEFSSISISPADFHGEWNYSIPPNLN